MKLIRERLSPNLYIHYGTTEVGIIAIATPDHVARIPGAVGAPVPGVKVEIVDAEGHPVPAGEIGEIRVRSAAAIDFYLDDEDENARAFQNGWFRPRDSVSLTEAGVLIHHGRADDVIILDGINIYPFEIEDALLEHEAVTEAVAFSVKSPARGDIPLAAVVVKRSLVRAELLNYCHSLLGEHAPHDVIALASLPRNAMGKVVKTELPDIYRHAVAARKGTS
jgi:acyl-coenzyme A synthetase/AMP-(fatty) acid ligase